MPRALPKELIELQNRIDGIATSYGLDMFPMRYEILDYDEINMVASYGGFPVRYPHWKWGMEYDRMSKSYEYGLHKIYEMVINNNPCYGYLLESNSMTDHKLVMCHVAGHNDFFKHNLTFRHTNRQMLDEMANHATRIRRYIDWYGVEIVEKFIDQVLSIDNLIDIHAPYIQRKVQDDEFAKAKPTMRNKKVGKLQSKHEYMEDYINPDAFIEAQKKKAEQQAKKNSRFPKNPERDVMHFLLAHAPLNRWQRDVLDMLREEAYYFAPQGMTKIMNEGWATYWHVKLMTEKAMNDSEVVDFADKHSGVVLMSRKQLNPYKIGFELYLDIENRWNKGQFGKEWDECEDLMKKKNWDKKLGLGREKIFEVRKTHNDVTFIDEFFTEDFCERQGLFAYKYDKHKKKFVIDSREFASVREKMLNQLTNFGQPVIEVTNSNYENKGELLLEHRHEGVDLDMSYGKETIKNIQALWKRSVHIQTVFEDKKVTLSFDGKKFSEKIEG